MLLNVDIVLASQSPRRKMLLETMVSSVRAEPSLFEETLLPGESAEAMVKRFAFSKAEEAFSRLGQDYASAVFLGADTAVCIDDKILGKPQNDAEAFEMLSMLNGREHVVITGVSLLRSGKSAYSFFVKTLVRFAKNDEDILRAYVRTGESRDKAGAYGIQGHAAALVESIEGSYSNVVGLPLCETLRALRHY